MDINKLFEQLKKAYGDQKWWPIYTADPGINKYRIENGLTYGIPYEDLKKFYTDFRDPYFEIAIGAILAQNVTWKSAAKAIESLYSAKALRPNLLLRIKTVELKELLKSTRYYTQKEKAIKIFSEWLEKDFGGDILKMNKLHKEEIRTLLLNHWGIGDETADSIMLYALNIPVFVIDVYTKRICKMNGIEFKKYADYQKYFETELEHIDQNEKTVKFQEFHALLVASGQDKHQKVRVDRFGNP